MATYNGNTSGYFRLVAVTSGTGSTRTITIYGQSIGYGHNWSGTLKRSGSWSGSTKVSFSSASSATVKKQFYKGTVSKSGTYKASISYWNGSSSVSVPITISTSGGSSSGTSKPGTGPKPTLERQSDNKCKVSWAAITGATSYVLQFSKDGAAASSSGTLTGRSSVRTGSTNARYRWRVAGRNSAGTGSFGAWSDSFYTQPKAPSGVTAVAASDTSALIKWKANAKYPYGARIERRGNSTINNVGTGTGTAATSYTRTGISEASLSGSQYRVQTFAGPNNNTRGRAFSAWSAWSAPVSVMKMANPPTNLTPDGGYVNAGGEPITLRWRHNPADGTGQQNVQLRFRPPEGEWQTITDGSVIGSAQFYTVTQSRWDWLKDEGPEIEWQACTQGANGVYSEWSQTATFTIVDQPLVTVLEPVDENTLTTNVLQVEWSYDQTQSLPQARWEAELTDLASGDVMEQLSGTGSAQEARFQTILEDETAYAVGVRAQSVGIWSEWDSVSFTTGFILPAPPVIIAFWDETVGGAQVIVAAGSGSVEATVDLQLFRSVDGGSSWAEVTGFVDAGDGPLAVTDWEARSSGETIYRAAAYSELGAMAHDDLAVIADSPVAWVQIGPDYEEPLRTEFNPTWSRSAGRQRKTVQYLGAGLPVAYSGEAVEDVFSVGGVLTTDKQDDDLTASPDELVEVMQADYPTLLWRDPTGAHVYGSASNLALTRDNHQITSWSATITRTRPDVVEVEFEDEEGTDESDTGDGDD